jgi:hypothetical protein
MRESEAIVRETTASAFRASPVADLIHIATSPWGGRTWLRVYAVSLAMAVFLSLIGALGSEHLPLITRLGYWLVTLLGGTVVTQLVSLAVCRFKLEPLPEALVLFAASTPGVIIAVWALTGLYWGHDLIAADLPAFVTPVTVITVAMSVLHYLFNRHPRQSHAFSAPQPEAPGQTFRARLPVKYREADILALSAEDHYLRVHTSEGEALILMRLYDAIRELDGIEGSQTHRSWWVAKDAIKEVVRSSGKVTLTIKGRLHVPVSRSYARALKAEGWLDLPARH